MVGGISACDKLLPLVATSVNGALVKLHTRSVGDFSVYLS